MNHPASDPEIDLGPGLGLLRPLRRSDAKSIARHANDRAIWLNLRDRFPHPYTKADADAWLRHVEYLPPGTNFAIAVDGEAVGTIALTLGDDVMHRSAELGYWLGRAYWGRGIATAALAAFTEHAFAAFDVCRLHAAVFEWNRASMRVLEKAGFAREGRLRKSVTKDGKTIDSFLYALTRD